jgi:Tol biopolymer transport system component
MNETKKMGTMVLCALSLVFVSSILVPLASAASGGVTRLTNIVNAYPHPSPDGEHVVFQSNRTGTAQIYVMAADGSNVEQLTNDPRNAETPKWSPDGKQILFSLYLGEDNNDVFIMDADGTNRRQLTKSLGYDGHASWSADGERIIFNSDRTSPDLSVSWGQRWHEVFSIRADGSDVRQHTHQQTLITYPSFSPDQSRIAYRKVVDSPAMSWDLSLGSRNSDVCVANADGSAEVNLTNNAAFDGWPAWSPDGALIAFASNRAGPANVGHLYVVSPDGEGLRQVTFGNWWGYVQPAWSADGEVLFAYQYRETSDYEFGGVARIVVGK